MDGKSVAKETEEALKERVEKIKQERGDVPTLATILVGNDPASATYVKMKGNACERVGMKSLKVELPETTSTEELLNEIKDLNSNAEISGILLQHPVPSQIDERKCFDAIDISKDVDGVTCLGFGNISMGEKAFGSCTPQGIMRLLEYYELELEGKHAVVVGRSPILGKPMAMMLLNKNATVTICHSRTKNTEEITRKADILIAACGRMEMVKKEWIKEKCVIIDVGINSKPDSSKKRGYRLVGDVDFEDVQEKVDYITPVPGGVGPMTIAMLMKQTVESAAMSIN